MPAIRTSWLWLILQSARLAHSRALFLAKAAPVAAVFSLRSLQPGAVAFGDVAADDAQVAPYKLHARHARIGKASSTIKDGADDLVISFPVCTSCLIQGCRILGSIELPLIGITGCTRCTAMVHCIAMVQPHY